MRVPAIARRPAAPGAEGWPWPGSCHPVLRQVYARRGLNSPDEIELNLSRLRPVGEFRSVDRAVELLLEHRQNRVIIYGDFDADGATSTALMVLCLRDFGFTDVDFFIPDRFELGYGLTSEAVRCVAARNPALIVTVDNGITSVEGVAAARASDIDVLITDHHLAGHVLPRANAIVNPNMPGDTFEGKHLAGVGVAFYLLAALGRALGNKSAVARYLDLVALGTMADVVHLDQSNRVLIHEGLRRVRAGHGRPGLRALCRVSGIDPGELRSSALAYQIAPRLNAAGRLEDMTIGVRCLLSDSEQEAQSLASKLDALNRERRAIESQMRAEALDIVGAQEALSEGAIPPVVCLYQEDWHEGVVGLIASRIKDRYHRPVVAFAQTSTGALKGSARSVPGFHIRDALAAVDAVAPALIERFGGHAMAAGLTLRADGLEKFTQTLEQIGAQRLGPELLTGRILTDGELAPEHFTVEVAQILRDAGPWGQGFPEPSFDGVFELIDRRIVGQAHLKMTLRAVTNQQILGAIAFNQADCNLTAGAALHLVYRLQVDDYRAQPSVQLVVEHIAAEASAHPA